MNVQTVQRAGTVIHTFQIWMIMKYLCRNACVTVKIMNVRNEQVLQHLNRCNPRQKEYVLERIENY